MVKYDVPVGWKQVNIGNVLKRVRKPVDVEPNHLYREIGIRSHGKGIFYKDENSGKSLGNKSVFWIEPDCFVVNIVFAWEQAVAKTTTNEMGMIASHRFPMYKPVKGKLDLDYILYFFKTPFGKHLMNLASPGGAGRNKTLGQQEFQKLSIPLPPYPEQCKIAEIISAWDEAITKTEQLIATLQNRKKGLMQRLLTGEIQFRDFGNGDFRKWRFFEKLPSNWDLVRLGSYAYIKARIGWRGLSSDEYVEDGPYLIAGKHIVGSKIVWDECDHLSEFRYQESPEIMLQERDVIITKDGTIGRVGFVENLPGLATINGTMMLIRPNIEFDSKYVYYYLQGSYFQELIKRRVSGSSVPHIFQRDIVKLFIPKPPKDEQTKIANILTSVDQEIESNILLAEKYKLQKKGLMQRLLTGQVRVKI